jgi:hypothetical protein
MISLFLYNKYFLYNNIYIKVDYFNLKMISAFGPKGSLRNRQGKVVSQNETDEKNIVTRFKIINNLLQRDLMNR